MVTSFLERLPAQRAWAPQPQGRRGGGGFVVVQQPLEQARAGLMQGVARGLLDGFELEGAALALLGEDHAQQPRYFLGDLLLDRCGRFFSCGLSAASSSSSGRSRQICSLTSTSSRLSC
jgi:hypothetical protein